MKSFLSPTWSLRFCALAALFMLTTSANAQSNPTLGPDFYFNWVIPFGGYDANQDGDVDSQDVVDSYFDQFNGTSVPHPGGTRPSADVSTVLQDAEDAISSVFSPINIPGAAPFFFGGGPPIEDAAIVDEFVLRNNQLYMNPGNNLDVNASGTVTPFDLLIVSNFVAANGSGTRPTIDKIAEKVSDNLYMSIFFGTSYPANIIYTSRSLLRQWNFFRNQSSPYYVAPPQFVDVNGDGVVTSLDILIISNNL